MNIEYITLKVLQSVSELYRSKRENNKAFNGAVKVLGVSKWGATVSPQVNNRYNYLYIFLARCADSLVAIQSAKSVVSGSKPSIKGRCSSRDNTTVLAHPTILDKAFILSLLFLKGVCHEIFDLQFFS